MLWDPSAFAFWAVNFRNNTATKYDELDLVDMSVKEIAFEYRKKLSVIPDGKLLMIPGMDKVSYGKRQADGVTIGQMFEEIGLIFEGVQEDPIVRTEKKKSMMKNKQLFWFRSLEKSGTEYKGYKKPTDKNGNVIEGKLIDKRNHHIDADSFAIIRLPVNLEKMKILDYIRPGTRVVADRGRAKEKPVFTQEQRVQRMINPLNLDYSEPIDYNSQGDLSEQEISEIINKLSGI